MFLTKSVLVDGTGGVQEFLEGPQSSAAATRQARIKAELGAGYLKKLIEDCRNPAFTVPQVDDDAKKLVRGLVDAVTSEAGRAIVGLTVLQLSIKAIEPSQSIRLHKSGGRGDNFSWAEGVPMRGLDKSFNTPALKESGLLSLNADGCFMTRSLAENYPYSVVYKAALKGARHEWLELVELVETSRVDARALLCNLLVLLIERSAEYLRETSLALAHVREIAPRVKSISHAAQSLLGFIDSSAHAARLFEVAMHSLCQVVAQFSGYDGFLKPLSQMRSANKKHGNIGDVELLVRANTLEIQCSWDAKYGKPYLRDELDELEEKLASHPETETVGFVTNSAPDLRAEIRERLAEIENERRVKIYILSFEQWAKAQYNHTNASESAVAAEWLVAFSECLCQRRRDAAPIDEPTFGWVKELQKLTLA